ncbi:MAG: IS3 family transposase [Gaiellaceae bacterium]
MATICRYLAVGRAAAYRSGRERPARYQRREDPVVYAQLKAVLRERGSYGYRRATVLVNRDFAVGYNRKRVQRVMRLTGLALAVRRRSANRRPHRGIVAMPGSNQRWCSDVMEIACWSGELVEVAFALDCSDREVLAMEAHERAMSGADIRRLMRRAVFARFGNERPPEVIEWLSDNGAIFTALETVIAAEKLNLKPITTPIASPESNGMAEAFVATLRRDYLDGSDRSSAGHILEQLPAWIADYNENAPHSALGYRSPAEHRRLVQTRQAEMCLTK